MTRAHLSSAMICVALFAAAVQAGTRFEDFATDPEWDELNNRASPQNFGFSNSSNVGVAGEMGGFVARDSSPAAYYGDRIETHTLNDSLLFNGTVISKGAPASSGFFVGFFNSSTPSGFFPKNFLGFEVVEGAGSSLLFYVFGSSSAQSGINFGVDNTGEVFTGTAPFNTPTPFSLVYDPTGNGSITAQVGGGSLVVVPLPATMRPPGASFDRFGLLSVQLDGGTIEAYFDNVTYTPEAASIVALLGLPSLLMLRRRRGRVG